MALPLASPFLAKCSTTQAPEDFVEIKACKPVRSSLQRINNKEERPPPTLTVATDKDAHIQKEISQKGNQHGQSGQFVYGRRLPTSRFAAYKDGTVQRDDYMCKDGYVQREDGMHMDGNVQREYHIHGQSDPLNAENPLPASGIAASTTLPYRAVKLRQSLHGQGTRFSTSFQSAISPDAHIERGFSAEIYSHEQSFPSATPLPASRIAADTDAHITKEPSAEPHQHDEENSLLPSRFSIEGKNSAETYHYGQSSPSETPLFADTDAHIPKEPSVEPHPHDEENGILPSRFCIHGRISAETYQHGQSSPSETPLSALRIAADTDAHIQKEPSVEENPLLPSRFALQGKISAETYQHGQSSPSEVPLSASRIVADTVAHTQKELSAEHYQHDEDPMLPSRVAIDMVHRELSAEDYQHGQSGPPPTKLEITTLLQNVDATVEDAKLIHDHIARHGPEMDRFVGNLFISLYGKHGAVIEARSVFNSMPERCVVSWNAMIAAYSQQGFANEALQLFQHMQQEGIKAGGATFVSALNACAELVDLPQGKVIHKMITDSGILPNSFVQTALINMYGRCGDLQEAKLVFDDIHPRDVVSWTSIISAYSHHGHGEESLWLFEQMQKEGIVPNIITFVSVLSSFESPAFLANGKLIHLYIVKDGLESDVIVATALINMYSKCGDLQYASSLFEKLHFRNIVSWSAMVGAYIVHGCSDIALQLFQEMQMEGIRPNKVTLLHALDACGDLEALDKGQTLYTSIINWGMETDVALNTSVINMFHQCGAMEDAYAVFNRISDRNVSVWNSMIGTYAQQGRDEKVLELFQSMQQEGVRPDDITFSSVVSACASLHALKEGEATHACIIDGGFELDTVVGTGLINMYGKCKSLRIACILFDKMVAHDTICFNALIGAFVQEGRDKGAMHLYDKMLKNGFKPDVVTYVNILRACANLAGQVKGEGIHASIIASEYNSEVPIANALMTMYGSCGDMDNAVLVFKRMRCRDIISWNALIAVLTQQGHAQEALQVFQMMQLECIRPNEVTFGSILAACSRTGLVKEAQGYFSSMTEDYRIAPTIEHCRCMIDLFARAGQLDDAEDFIVNSQLLTNALAWMTLLSSCRLYDDTERGIRAAEIAIQLDPQNATPFVLLLNIYARVGRWDDVEKVKQRMIEKGLKDPGSFSVDVDKIL